MNMASPVRLAILVVCLAMCDLGATLPAADAPDGRLSLSTRRRIEVSPGGPFAVLQETASWQDKQTAVIVCDMWARHWCQGAIERGAEMAPRPNGEKEAHKAQTGDHRHNGRAGIGTRNAAEFSAAAGVKVAVASGLISGESCIVDVGDEAGSVEKDVGLV